MRFIDLTGQKFGRLTVLTCTRKMFSNQTRTVCRCVCDCGVVKDVRSGNLRRGRGSTESCGCLQKELTGERASLNTYSRTHGESVHGTITPEYIAWCDAKSRCDNPKHHVWKHYGGKNVSMCPRWAESYELFLLDVGRRPTPQHSMGRILDRGNYEPANAFWMTRAEQGLNKRNNNALSKWATAAIAAEGF